MQIEMRVTSVIRLHTLIFITTILLFPTHHRVQAQSLITAAGGGAAAAVKITKPPLLPPLQNLLSFADQRLAVVYQVIQRFKNTHLRSLQHHCHLERRRYLQIQRVLLRGAAGQPLRHRRRFRRLQRLPSLRANSRRIPRPAPGPGPLPRQLQLLLRRNPAVHRRPPVPLRARPQQQQSLCSFPAAVLAMDGLSFLDIRFNSFSGEVTPELFAKGLDLLFLNNNNFTTRLPEDVDATHVAYLTLANNKFFGPIPRSIAKTMAGLSEIVLLNNLLSGCLPYELGLLKDAVVFDAGNNNLTGPLPFSLGCLDKLEVLNLAANLMYGEVPEPLCRLGNLRNLSLSDNYFMGAAPSCLRLIDDGVLDVRKNCIPGQASQRPVAECAAFMARPRYCPYSDTYSKIPCWIPYYGWSEVLVPAPSPSPS